MGPSAGGLELWHSVTLVVQDHRDLAFMDYSSLVMHSSLKKEGGEASEILHRFE